MINEFDKNALTRMYFHSPQGAGRAALGHVDGANPASGAYRYYTHDHLGSTRGVYDHAKTRLARFDYTPYGETYHAENPGITTRQFTGHDWSPQTGLYFAPFRYYNPAASRWLTRDPLGMVDGPNVYAYVRGNPINHFDALGLECCTKWEKAKAWARVTYHCPQCARHASKAYISCSKCAACLAMTGTVVSPFAALCIFSCGICAYEVAKTLWHCTKCITGMIKLYQCRN